MSDDRQNMKEARAAQRAHFMILAGLQSIMGVQLILLVSQQEWPQAVFLAAIMVLTIAPVILRMPVEIPSEIQILGVLFVFATLFLGELRDYYERFWWWDAALHTLSGLLLGLLGFLFVYILNEDRNVDLHMRPSFVALFAFFFGVGLGGLWEIFEFGMDQSFGTNMQPATAGDPSGLSDTIHDLIVDTVGAAVISLGGWRYLVGARRSPVDSWAKRFIKRNPQLFGD